jgi:uncharacterized protein
MTIAFLAGLLCSALIGLSLGLIGGGGSIITLPVLVYLLSVEPHAAMGMSLAVVGTTSLFGAGLHYRNGNVNLRAGLLFATTGILGAYFGTRLTYLLSAPALLITFASLMLVVSARMLLAKQPASSAPHGLHISRLLAAGLGVGVLTGFLGVGGGFLIVPALLLSAGLGMKQAVGTSLLVIAINCASGLAGHMQRASFDWRLAGLVTLCALAGAIVGTGYAHATHPETLRRIFAYFVLAVALFLFYRNLPLVL